MKKLLPLVIGLLTLSTLSKSQDLWTPSITDGFGFSPNNSINCLHVLNGQLYAGTGSDSGFVYATQTGYPGTWTKVFSKQGYNSVDAINSLIQGNNSYLYISAEGQNIDSSKVFRSADGGLTWSPYYTASPNDKMPFIVPFKGAGAADSIYIVKNNWNGSQILKSAYDSNDPLNTSNTWDTVFSISNLVASVCKHNNKLYIGGSGGMIWSSPNGNSWSKDSSLANTLGNMSSNSISAMASFGGYLYIGTVKNYDTAQIWRSNDDINWVMVKQYQGYRAVTSIDSITNELWISLESSKGTGGQIIRSTDGITFNSSNNNGFGIYGDNGTGGCFAHLQNQFQNFVYYGCQNSSSAATQGGGLTSLAQGLTVNSTGGQIWRVCLGTLPNIIHESDVTVCDGTPVTFNAGSGGNVYLWDNGSTTQSITTTTAGEHYVFITGGADGCINSDTVKLIALSSPTVYSNLDGPPIVCKNDTLSVSTYTYSNLRNPIHDSVSNLPGLNLPIPYGQSVSDTIHISIPNDNNEYTQNSFVSVTIDSLLNIDASNLVLKLYAPNGYYTTLASYSGTGSNFIGTVFAPGASTFIASGTGNFTGTFSPYDSFSNLDYSAVNGTWTLEVYNGNSNSTGTLKGWTLRFSEPDTVMNYSWSTTAGFLGSTTSHNLWAKPLTSTTYVLTATNNIGCSATDTIRVTVPALHVSPASTTVCNGNSATLSATGGSTYFWSPTASLNNPTGDTVIASTLTTTTFYVVDTMHFCPLSDSVIVNVNPILSVSSSTSQTICFADTAILAATGIGGTAPYTYSWNDGTTNHSGGTVHLSPTTATTYTVIATDVYGCTAFADSTTIAVIPSTDIYGHVDLAGNSVTNGVSTAVLYKRNLQYQSDTVRIDTLNASGDYLFTHINHGDYFIKVFPDTGSYHIAIPTYYGDKFLWDSATVINHGCGMIDTANISLLHDLAATGTGILAGKITDTTGFGRAQGDAIPGVNVGAGKNPGGQMFGHTTTDSNGKYRFDNVPQGNYTIFVDIPGLNRYCYNVTIDSLHTQYLHLDYVVDSTTIDTVHITSTTVGINQPSKVSENNFSIYPNPFKGNTTIEYNVSHDANISLDVYNVLGIKVQSLVKTNQSSGIYKVNLNSQNNHLNAGIYFISLSIDGKTNTQRIVLLE
jgi:hypothetical protein